MRENSLNIIQRGAVPCPDRIGMPNVLTLVLLQGRLCIVLLEGMFNGGDAAKFDKLNLGQAGQQVSVLFTFVFFERPQGKCPSRRLLEMSCRSVVRPRMARKSIPREGRSLLEKLNLGDVSAELCVEGSRPANTAVTTRNTVARALT